MKPSALSVVLALSLAAAASAEVDPRERNFQILVDGAAMSGVVGYSIEYTRNPLSRDDQRRLGVAYSPDQRRLVLTVTQKGLNQLQDWLNSATDTAAPAPKTVTVIAKDNQDTVLARWELTSVVPQTFSSRAAGTITEIDSTVEFLFDRLRLVQASGK
jgi:hypothetical protein